MKSEWNRVQIGSLCSRVCSGGTPKSTNESYYGGEIPWLNTKEVNFNRIYNTENTITEAGLANSSAKWIKENCVIVAMYGATAGRCAITKVALTTNQACCNLEIDAKKADYRFVYYALKNEYARLASAANGGAQQNLNAQIIKEFDIPFPPLTVQRKIASILSALDDKIEANNAICRNLEEQMQIMYDYLFVSNSGDMRQIGTISDLGQVMGGGTPSKKESAYYTQRGIPWITPKDLSRNSAKFITQGEIDITPEGLAASSATLMPTGTVLFSSRAPVGYIAIADAEVTTNQGFKSVIPKETIGTAYLYYFLKTNKKVIEMRASGSTFPEVSASIMRQIPAIVPGRRSLNIFNAFCKPRFELQRKLEAEILNIAQLGDALLLNLLSGDMNIQN